MLVVFYCFSVSVASWVGLMLLSGLGLMVAAPVALLVPVSLLFFCQSVELFPMWDFPRDLKIIVTWVLSFQFFFPVERSSQ
jgi:hypothetical protein